MMIRLRFVVSAFVWLLPPVLVLASENACLGETEWVPCDGLEDPAICEVIRDRFCEPEAQECEIEAMPADSYFGCRGDGGGGGGGILIRGRCWLSVSFEPCIGLVDTGIGGLAPKIVVEPIQGDDWHPGFSLHGDLDISLPAPWLLHPRNEDALFSSEARWPLTEISLFEESCHEDLADPNLPWPWAQVVRSAPGPGLPKYRGKRRVRVALIDSGVSQPAFDEIKLQGIQLVPRDTTHPLHCGRSVVDLPGNVHGHGTIMASVMANAIAQFLSPDTLGSISIGLYRSFHGKCAPAVSVTKAIEDAVEQGHEIIVLAADMSFGNPRIKDAIELALDNDVLVVVGTSNENRHIDETPDRFPAAWNSEGLLVVSAIDACHRTVAVFSEEAVDLFAPGRAVPGLNRKGIPIATRGSSVSAAVVSILAAVALSQLPDDFKAKGLEEFLVAGVNKSHNLNGKARSGGVVDLDATVRLALSAVTEGDMEDGSCGSAF